MNTPWLTRTSIRRGSAYILALLILVVITTLAVSLATTVDLNVQKSNNYRRATDARLVAESGLSFMLRSFKSVRLPHDTTDANFLDNMTSALGGVLDGTTNIYPYQIARTDTAVVVPQISLDGGAFNCWVEWVSEDKARLTVEGTARGILRRVAIDLMLVPKPPAIFDYGLASKGQITISGHAAIVGVNYAGEANVLSATTSHDDAICIDGNVTISGDLSTVSGDVAMQGPLSIAGETDYDVIRAEHIHTGVNPPDFPELNTAPLIALATGDVINATTDTSSPGQVFNNATIAAGTNPTFGSDTVINGVLYIEAPNVVRFGGHSTINGLIVTEDNDLGTELCEINFAGHVTASGVDALPEAGFEAVKEQTGTFILAPGFGATFAGTFTTVNGTIAADQLTFTGTAEGTIKGSVVGLADLPTTISGNVDIQVDRQNADDDPAGFLKSFAPIADPDSYLEPI